MTVTTGRLTATVALAAGGHAAGDVPWLESAPVPHWLLLPATAIAVALVVVAGTWLAIRLFDAAG